MAGLNLGLKETTGSRYQMSMSALELDRAAGKLTWFSAGAPRVLILRGDGAVEMLSCQGSLLGAGGLSLGRQERALVPGERIFVTTDGLPELALPSGRELGWKRLAALLGETRRLAPKDASRHIVAEIDRLRLGVEQRDDITFALIDVRA
jgi:sigma-B regulation protein RsbU (phosphoserine phosphatase)